MHSLQQVFVMPSKKLSLDKSLFGCYCFCLWILVMLDVLLVILPYLLTLLLQFSASQFPPNICYISFIYTWKKPHICNYIFNLFSTTICNWKWQIQLNYFFATKIYCLQLKNTRVIKYKSKITFQLAMSTSVNPMPIATLSHFSWKRHLPL
jgi:hypothetical protein